MTLSSETIQKYAANFLEYQKGRALYHRMQAAVNRETKGFRSIELEGTVRDLSRQYEVLLEIGDEEILNSSCSCNEYMRTNGICRHRIAVLFQYMNSGKEEEHILRTSPAGSLLIRNYEKKDWLSAMSNKDPEPVTELSARKKVRLVPRIVMEGKRMHLEFRIGYERLYIIRDLYMFYQSFQNGESIEFGKGFSFVNGENMYADRSLELVRLVSLQMSSYIHHHSRDGLFLEKIRTLELEEAFVDDYMGLFAADGVDYQDEKNEVYHLPVVFENGKPEIVIAAKGKSGAHISISGQWKAVMGKKRIYLLDSERIYACDEDYSHDLRAFYSCLLRRAYPYAGHMDIGGTDLPAVQRYVFPFLKKHLPVVFSGIDLETYASPMLDVTFYLDISDETSLSIQCDAHYGGYAVWPLVSGWVPEAILRDRDREQLISDTLMKYFESPILGKTMFLRNKEEALYDFLTQGLQELHALGTVSMTERVQQIHVRSTPKIRVHMSFVSDVMQLQFDTDGLEPGELSLLIQSYGQRKKYHRFSNGDIMRLEENLTDAFYQLSEGVLKNASLTDAASLNIPVWHGMYLNSLFQEQEMVALDVSAEVREMLLSMKQAKTDDYAVPASMETILYDYQKYGFGWLKTLQKYHFGGILADDMGLGKTLQMIALLLADQQEGRTSLVVCPASLIYNWQSEIRRFAPSLSCLVVSGQAEERERLLQDYKKYDVLVTSYDLVRRDGKWYEGCRFYYEVLDEAQYIKNHNTINARAAKQIQAEYRVALTGTPIENRLSELWSIFDYLMPGYLYQHNRFRQLFELGDTDKKDTMLDGLKRMVAPFILRRRKQDVLKELPDKNECVVYSGLEGVQKKLYQAAFLQLKEQLSGQEQQFAQQDKMKILAQLTRLRQICCDPSLCFEEYEGGSAKLDTCMELVNQAVNGEHKLLLFSQFTSMLDIISHRMDELSIRHLMLTGSTSKEDRVRLVEEFQTGDVPVFLISLKAGGTGLNLTAADLVIHYDPWWNMAAQNQATDRAHRLGQEKAVTVYRLIAKDTLEESILKLQEEKKQLSEDILSADFTSLAALSQEELIGLLEQ